MKHGKKGTPVYRAWQNMKTRTTNPNCPQYADYMGRGIKLDRRWRNFVEFYRDMGDPPTEHHTLERIDNDGPYTKANCRWATRKEQARNRRSSVLLEFGGEIKPLPAWADELGLRPATLWLRLYQYGWSVERALTTSLRPWSPGNPRK